MSKNNKDNFSDYHDYFGVIDDGYLTIEEFLLYNRIRNQFPYLTDDEIESVIQSNEKEILQ